MKKEDLRIGNYVGFGTIHTGLGQEESTAHYTVSYLTEGAMFFKESNVGEYYDDVVPISLTDEWLIKFHFSEIEGNRYSLYIGEWYFVASQQYKYIDICMKKDFNAMLRIKNVEYVHNLQNLYYSILGKELVI